MKRNLFVILLLSLMLLQSNLCIANDGYAAITTGGIEFQKSDNISIEKEVLFISPREIRVEYLFKNNSDNEIETIIAFPMPDVQCGWFEIMNYPDNFKAFVNGNQINLEKEIKAIVYSDLKNYEIGQDVTKLLLDYGIPLDCRNISEVKKREILDSNSAISVEFKKLIALGLVDDPRLDAWDFYYKTQIKYYWKQKFPSNGTLRIQHTYSPSLGTMNGYYAEDRTREIIDDKIEMYRKFHIDNFGLDKEGKDFSCKDKGYHYLNYILNTANTWKGPIKEFSLILENTGNLTVSTMGGPFEAEGGNLKIKKINFSPSKDLSVFFFD